MASSGKLQEAEKHITDAEKCLKTSMFKWNPDYDNAANHFDKAAICFRTLKYYERAKDSSIRASDAHYKNHAIYHAGKSLEHAANVCRDAKQLEEAAKLYEQAGECYSESGHPDTAGQIILKGAQLLQHENPALAAKYFLSTAEFLQLDDKFRESANAIKNAVRMYCRTRPRQLDKIISTAQQSRRAFLEAGSINLAHEAVTVEIIATLLQGNSMHALDLLQEASRVPDFKGTEDEKVLEQLVESVSQHDAETMIQCCNSGILKSLDPEYAKLVRDLKTGSESVDPTHQTVKPDDTSVQSKPQVTSMAVKGTRKDPAVLADMRNQLLSTSKGTSSKNKKKTVEKSRVETTPPPPSEIRGLEEIVPEEPDEKIVANEEDNKIEDEDKNENEDKNEEDKNDDEDDEDEDDDEDDEPIDVN